MAHHTKDKGDLAVAMVIADLAKHDILVCLPISEHLPFDLIAVNTDYRLSKVQVKYKAQKRGFVSVNLRSSYADRNGSHVKLVDRTSFDAYAIYCPETDKVYYIRNEEIRATARAGFTLRINSAKNNQIQNVNFADNYLGAYRLFC